MAGDLAFALRTIDLEERHLSAATQLHEANEHIAAIVRSSPAAIFSFDPDGRILTWNDAAGRIFGWSAEEAIGQPIPIVPPDRQEEHLALKRTVLAGKAFTDIEVQRRCKDGSTVWVSVSTALLRDDNDRAVGIMEVAQDIEERRRMETDIRDSERRFHSLFDNMNEGLAFCRMVYTDGVPDDFVYLDVNAAFGQQTGLSDVTGKRVSEVIPGIRESDRKLIDIYGEVAGTGIARRFEFYVETLQQWFDVSAYSPEKGYFVSVFDVVTERKRTEEAGQVMIDMLKLLNTAVDKRDMIHSALHRLQRFSRCEAVGIRLKGGPDYPYYETSGFSDTFVKLENHLCTYNEKGEALYGDDGRPLLECMCGNIIQGRFDPEKSFFTTDGCFWSNCTTDLLASTTDTDRQARTRNRCNGVGYESVALIPLRSGRETYGLLQFNDRQTGRFTEQSISLLRWAAENIAIFLAKKQAEEELRHSREQYRNLVENMDDIVFSTDTCGLFTYISPTLHTFGYTPGELIGKVFYTLKHPDEPDAMREMFSRVLEGSAEPGEFRILDKDGITHVIHVSCRRVQAGDTVTGVTGVITDVTGQRRTEEQLRMAQKMEVVGRLAGGVAHDFNNLLSVIMHYADFALDGVRQNDPLRKDILEIQKAAERAASLTRQLLAFSRKQMIQPRTLDLNGVVSGMEGMLSRLIGEDIELVFALGSHLNAIQADPGQIEQIVMNLVVNSRDAMPGGGRIVIETGNAELDAEYANRHMEVAPGRYVRLSVTDNGQGMDEETCARIFEPFFTTKGQGGGTGLGLATVYGIVRQNNGNIWVYSEPGKGTTIKCYLPWQPPKQADEAEPPLRRISRSSGGETVLVVEDETAVRDIVKRILEAAGYTVLTAANGGEALLTCEQWPEKIHLLLTDVIMPRMNGRELAGRLARVRPGLKNLYMSGYTDNSIVHHGVLDSETHFISKPFNSMDLTNKVREVLDQEPDNSG